MINPKSQTTEEIVAALLTNNSHQYTESAHAEIFRRLSSAISQFNKNAERTEKVMLVLAFSQVFLAIAQVFLGIIQLKK